MTNEERQANLYEFLLKKGDMWTRMIEASCCVEGYPIGWTSSFHNSQARRVLTRDIEEINASDKYEKIIISGNRGIKLANAEEFERFVRSEYAEIFRKLRRVRSISWKGALNLQGDLDGNIIESFIIGNIFEEGSDG